MDCWGVVGKMLGVGYVLWGGWRVIVVQGIYQRYQQSSITQKTTQQNRNKYTKTSNPKNKKTPTHLSQHPNSSFLSSLSSQTLIIKQPNIIPQYNKHLKKKPSIKMIEHQNSHEQQMQNWQDKYRVVVERLANLQHQHKKIDIEIRNDLEFERKRANEFQEKYKNAIRYKNQEQEFKRILNELNQALTSKENQILDYIKAEQDRKRKIADLDTLNQQLRDQLSQIQQGAISALLEKDNIISSLEEKLIQLENVDSHSLQAMIVELEEKFKELQDKSEAEKRDMESVIELKDEEIREIRDKMDLQRQRYEQKVALLEQQIISFEKHIEKITEQRNHEQNFQQKYYSLQQKQRKTQKKLQQFEMAYKTQKQDFIDAIQKMENELATKVEQTEELKNTQNKLREMEKDIKNKKKQLEDSKAGFEKVKGDYLKKITQLQQEKKKVQDSYEAKNSQFERLKAEIQQHVKTPKLPQKKQQNPDDNSLSIELQAMPIKTASRRESTEQTSATIEKLRTQIKNLEQNIDELNTRLAQSTKQVQSLRERLVTTSGSASRSDGEAQLLVQIEDLNSYIKKVQHNLMITKLKYAEDESHWSSRESELKKQVQKLDRKSKKEKAELIERIDRMKKTNAKDKKTDYYQSSLK